MNVDEKLESTRVRRRVATAGFARNVQETNANVISRRCDGIAAGWHVDRANVSMARRDAIAKDDGSTLGHRAAGRGRRGLHHGFDAAERSRDLSRRRARVRRQAKGESGRSKGN